MDRLLRRKAIPGLQWAILPSHVAFSVCHMARLENREFLANLDDYSKRFEAFLSHNSQLLHDATLFHLPCMFSARRKGVVASLELAGAVAQHIEGQVTAD